MMLHSSSPFWVMLIVAASVKYVMTEKSPFSPHVNDIAIPRCKGLPIMEQFSKFPQIPPVRESRFWVRMTESLVQKGLKTALNFTIQRHPHRSVTNYQLDQLEREILQKLGEAAPPEGCKDREHFPHIFCGEPDFFIQSNVGSPLTTLCLNKTGMIPVDIGEQVHCLSKQMHDLQVRHLDLRCDHFTLSKQGTLGLFDFNKAVILSRNNVMEISKQVQRDFNSMKPNDYYQMYTEKRACFCIFTPAVPDHLKLFIQKRCNDYPLQWGVLLRLMSMLADPSIKNEELDINYLRNYFKNSTS